MICFMCCKSYESEPNTECNDTNGEIYEKQLKAGVAIENRCLERKPMLEKQEAGQSKYAESITSDNCREMLKL